MRRGGMFQMRVAEFIVPGIKRFVVDGPRNAWKHPASQRAEMPARIEVVKHAQQARIEFS